MISLERPSLTIETLYTACVQQRRKASTRTALQAESQRVFSRARAYRRAAERNTLFSLVQEDAVDATEEQLRDLYDDVLVAGSQRAVYDALKAATHLRLCPLCGHGYVKSLDHYLPKENYPEFAVLPINLLPSCTDCNKTKHLHLANTSDEQLFHPYFDDWSGYDFLDATVLVGDSIEVDYSINQAALPDDIGRRASTHFRVLALNELYSTLAARELVTRKTTFARAYGVGDGSPEDLQESLEEEHRRWLAVSRNCWQRVLYRQLLQTPAFYEGGFRQIDAPRDPYG